MNENDFTVLPYSAKRKKIIKFFTFSILALAIIFILKLSTTEFRKITTFNWVFGITQIGLALYIVPRYLKNRNNIGIIIGKYSLWHNYGLGSVKIAKSELGDINNTDKNITIKTNSGKLFAKIPHSCLHEPEMAFDSLTKISPQGLKP